MSGAGQRGCGLEGALPVPMRLVGPGPPEPTVFPWGALVPGPGPACGSSLCRVVPSLTYGLVHDSDTAPGDRDGPGRRLRTAPALSARKIAMTWFLEDGRNGRLLLVRLAICVLLIACTRAGKRVLKRSNILGFYEMVVCC